MRPCDDEKVVMGAVGCPECGEVYDSIWGVPFFGGMEVDDVPFLMAIMSHANKFRQVNLSESDSYEFWERLLSDYHGAEQRSTFLVDRKLPEAEKVATWFPYRYNEWLEITSLTRNLDLRGKAVLDVGAGGGFDSYRLMAAGARVTALEADPTLIYQGRKKLPGVRWIGGFSHVLPFADESFDYVFCNAALHHMCDIPGAIIEMLRVLKTEGWMVTTCDPYQADFSDEARELKVFDRHPSVLLGVNERLPRFSEFITTLECHEEQLEVQIFTHGVRLPLLRHLATFFNWSQGLLSRVPLSLHLEPLLLRGGRWIEDLREWNFPKDGKLLSKTSGSIALKVRKKRSIASEARLQRKESLRVGHLAESLDNENEGKAVAHIARILPLDFVNIPFLQAPHSKFLLLNGWRSNHAHPRVREAYRLGRWFLRRSQEQTCLYLEVLSAGPVGAPSPEFEILINGSKVFSQRIARGIWIPASILLPPLSIEEAFAVELHIRGSSEDFGENLICVRRLELGASELNPIDKR